MRACLISLLSGTLFGAGLAVADMTNPAKVIGFLDVAGAWDPSLAFVMGAALLVSAAAQAVDRRRRGAPALRPRSVSFAEVDTRLLGGAALFGIGWGLAGFCPGPALAALVTGAGAIAVFVAAMLAGMGLFHFCAESPASHRPVESQA